MMLKRREKGLKMKSIAAQSTASYGLAQQPTFLHAAILNTSKNAYNLFAAKMLQLSNAAIYSKYNRRRQTPIQQNVCGDDGDVGTNRCFCDYKTPCNRQKLRQNILNSKCMQHRRLKQIRLSEQTTSLQYRPNIDVVAATFETALEVELVAAPEIAVNGSVAQNPTATSGQTLVLTYVLMRIKEQPQKKSLPPHFCRRKHFFTLMLMQLAAVL
uniref:Uncharacterized protein n=1 Tax=Bactrocera dorsalis TaxID=27457 RepID=A0A034WHM3_BACDO